MHVPKHHEENDLNTMHMLMRAHALGAWIIQRDGELIANHTPTDIG